MAIVDVNGRPRSVFTEEELLDAIERDFEALTPDERAAFLALAKSIDAGDMTGIEDVSSIEYEEEPVDPLTFLREEYFLGAIGANMYPRLQEDFNEVFTGGYTEACLLGSLGWGKSFLATCAMSYLIYQMSCLRDPQAAYGLSPGSTIAVALLSVTREVARRVPLQELYAKLNQSPYFHEKFPFKFAGTMYEIRFPKNILVTAGSSSTSSLGGNVFGGFIDEVSFMGDVKSSGRAGRNDAVDRGEQVHTAIIRRMKSRFQKVGRLPGILFTVSSKERPVAFVEKLVKEARETNDMSVFVREYSTWEVKPSASFSADRFKVAVGNDRVRHRLDPTPEQEDWYRDQGLQVIDVPVDYRKDFETDLEGALRDIAGIATEAVSPFIHRVERIAGSEDPSLSHPLDFYEWVAGTGLVIHWDKIATPTKRRLPGGFEETAWVPKRHPGAPRHAHIDQALTKDSAGVAIGHVSGYREVQRRSAAGDEYTELAPVIEFDLLLAVKPPPGDEIVLGDLRTIVYAMVEHGFPIAFVSMDRWQSVDAIQQFRARGLEADVVSVDRVTEPYETLKAAIYEDRTRWAPNPILRRELTQLQRTPRANGVKIDHPAKGSKDVADAACGVVYTLTSQRPSAAIPFQVSHRSGYEVADDNDPSWVIDGARMVQPAPTIPARGRVSSVLTGDEPVFRTPFIKG